MAGVALGCGSARRSPCGHYRGPGARHCRLGRWAPMGPAELLVRFSSPRRGAREASARHALRPTASCRSTLASGAVRGPALVRYIGHRGVAGEASHCGGGHFSGAAGTRDDGADTRRAHHTARPLSRIAMGMAPRACIVRSACRAPRLAARVFEVWGSRCAQRVVWASPQLGALGRRPCVCAPSARAHTHTAGAVVCHARAACGLGQSA